MSSRSAKFTEKVPDQPELELSLKKKKKNDVGRGDWGLGGWICGYRKVGGRTTYIYTCMKVSKNNKILYKRMDHVGSWGNFISTKST